MAFLVLLIGAVLLVSAIRNTHGELLTAIKTDAPAFAVWGAAIFAVAVIGFIPGLKPVSRGLLALLVLVLVLTNYQGILSGFQSAWQGASKQAAAGVSPSSGTGAASGGTSGGLDWLSSLGSNTGFDFSSLSSLDVSGSGAPVNG